MIILHIVLIHTQHFSTKPDDAKSEVLQVTLDLNLSKAVFNWVDVYMLNFNM